MGGLAWDMWRIVCLGFAWAATLTVILTVLIGGLTVADWLLGKVRQRSAARQFADDIANSLRRDRQ